MDTWKQFRSWLVPALIVALCSIVGWMYVNNSTAQAAAVAEVRAAQMALSDRQSDHAERLAKLEALVELQKEFNRQLIELLKER